MMSMYNKFELFDMSDNAVATVIPRYDGTFGVFGHYRTLLHEVRKELTRDELDAYKELHSLRTVEELGQMDIFDMI